MDLKKTETTRYLCAAAYLDMQFRNQVIERVVEEKHKSFGISYGVDLVTIVKHCLAARSRKTTRDILLAVLFISTLFFIRALDNPGVLILSFIVAWAIVFVEMISTRYGVVAKHLLRGNFNPDFVNIQPDPRIEKTLEDIAKEQNSNAVVYSGFSPFVGSGFDLDGWSFALNIHKGKESAGRVLEPLPFQVEELYGYLTNAVGELELDGLSIEDKLYVNGQEIRDDQRFLSDPLERPNTQVDPSLINTFIENPTQAVRHYKSIQVVGWKGELVLSIFLRFSKTKQSLFAEASYLLLPPLREEYHKVDSIHPTPTLRTKIELLYQCVFTTPFLWAFSPVIVLSKILRSFGWWRQDRENKRIIKGNLTFDYGATTSIRESASSPAYRRYFQKLDKEMYLKIIERQILDSIIEFVDGKNIDTSDLKDRQTTILNNGVIVSGGSIKAESLAVGEKARAAVTRLTGAARSATKTSRQGTAKM